MMVVPNLKGKKMREIKFRALMKNANDEHFVSEGYGIDNGLSYLFDFEDSRWDNFLDMIVTSSKFIERFKSNDEWMNGWYHIRILQFTGLRDKNGVEIYEGDIVVLFGANKPIEIIFKNGSFGYCVPIHKDFCPIACNNYFNFKRLDIKVIGNIYENPELLEE